MISNTAILPTAYFAPVQFYAKYVHHKNCIIDTYEHYRKQTYRNRCVIYGANGQHLLSIPVKKPNGNKTLVKDILIDYDTNWQHNHFKAIESAYRSSPFFEYYIDELMFVFERRFEKLVELNHKIQEVLFSFLQWNIAINYSMKFVEKEHEMTDYRDIISPKTSLDADNDFESHAYPQVFEEKHGFLKNLSILDLLFNEGPNADLYLKNTLKI